MGLMLLSIYSIVALLCVVNSRPVEYEDTQQNNTNSSYGFQDTSIPSATKLLWSSRFLNSILFILIAGFLYMRRNNLEFLYNKHMWAVAAVFFCCAMVSGQMWNQIKCPPFCHWTKNGPVYIKGGSHGQFVLESFIVAILNGAVVVGMIIMTEAAGGVCGTDTRTQAEGKNRRIQTFVGLVLVCVFFSMLLSVFRAKTQVYPYSFLFK